MECTGRRKFAELMSDHVFRNLYGQKLLTVINTERQTDELRKNCRTTRPDLDHFVTTRRAGYLSFIQQIPVDERAFPDGTCHLLLPLTCRSFDDG
ncbi:hypothetical protein ApDm4_0901 [Acetobacter pomorum]|nr:hypothetical protein ApDm4_0901 [Acetobacter pomorum]